MTRRRRTHVTALPLILLALTAALALTTIYRNVVYLAWTGHAHAAETTSGLMTVTVGLPEEINHGDGLASRIKLSVPFDEAGPGCEFIYAVGVVERDTAQRRYLLKFRYDLRNKRCECKDLYSVVGFVPERAVFQLVRVSKEDDEIVETPVPEGLEVRFSGDGEQIEVESTPVRVPASAPFKSAERTKLVEKFSTSLDPANTQLLVTPRDSIGAFVVEELDRRTEQCTQTGKCDRIRMAVAMVTDPIVLRALERAERAGVAIEWIENLHGSESEVDTTLRPLKWLRGNPLLDHTGTLPMHAKFIIFGDDMVLSTGANLDFDRWPDSRQIAVVYRSDSAAAIFGEIFTMIRTSLYYPVEVDMRDDLVVLFNAERPRGYSAFSQKPYLSIETEEGVASNAYGILFDKIDRTAGPLRLSMSPISDSCERYQRVHCLYRILRERANEGQLELVLNRAFYLGERHYSAPSGRELEVSPAFARVASLFPDEAVGLSLMTHRERSVSMHHERVGLLGEDVVLLGSANYARPNSQNTIEVLRSPALHAELTATWHDSDANEVDLVHER